MFSSDLPDKRGGVYSPGFAPEGEHLIHGKGDDPSPSDSAPANESGIPVRMVFYLVFYPLPLDEGVSGPESGEGCSSDFRLIPGFHTLASLIAIAPPGRIEYLDFPPG